MPRLASGLPAARLFVLAFLTIAATTGCGEKRVGFKTTVVGNDFNFSASPPDSDRVTFTIHQKSRASAGKTVYVKPQESILKLPGSMPLLPEDVREEADSFTLRFRLPEEGMKDPRPFQSGSATNPGQLIVPAETGVVAFSGLEHRIPGATYALVQMDPVPPIRRDAPSIPATELYYADPNAFGKLGLHSRAEKVVQRGKLYLLIRIHASDFRTIATPNGGTELERSESERVAFLPFEVACDRISMQSGGKAYRPHASSLCTQTVKLANRSSVPLYVAFDYPPPGEASITVPVTVLRPDPPVQTTLRNDLGPELYRPQVTERLLGAHEITARLPLQ